MWKKMPFSQLGTEIDNIVGWGNVPLFHDKMSAYMKNLSEFSAPAGVEVNIMPVIGEASSLKVDTSSLPPVIPVLALRNAVIFPGTVFPVTVGREKSIKLVSEAEEGDGWLAAIPQMDISIEEPGNRTCASSARCASLSRLWKCRTAPSQPSFRVPSLPSWTAS